MIPQAKERRSFQIVKRYFSEKPSSKGDLKWWSRLGRSAINRILGRSALRVHAAAS